MHVFSGTCAGGLAALLSLAAVAAPAAPVGQPSPPAPAAASADTLDDARGGSDAIAIDTRVQGNVSGNSATNVTTGNNVIQSGSFANTAGIAVVVQNTGANVLIQHATVVNLQFK